MFVYVGTSYKATVSGAVAVAVRCEQCQKKYYYELSRTATGVGQAPYGLGAEGAQKRARKAARDRLSRMLENEVEAVPCPCCGAYQEAMFPLLRRPRLRWMQGLAAVTGTVGWILALGTGLLLADHNARTGVSLDTAYVLWGVAALLILAAVALLLLRRARNAAYNPNDPETEEKRIKRGRRLSISKEEADRLTQGV